MIDNVLIETVAVPEPASLALLGLGGLMIANRRR
ncbi:MAG: PEP-CTERM sorting domain-containing protein [Phycisphaerales bacterium]